MKNTKPGGFEELVLLTAAVLREEDHGAKIRLEPEKWLNEGLSVGPIQSALRRMEQKGFLTSVFEKATRKRGGKCERMYPTTFAHRILAEIKDVRAGLSESIPKLDHGLKTI